MNRQFWAQLAFAGVAVVVIAFTASYTQLYSQSVNLLGQLQAVDLQQLSDRAERFYRIYTKHGDSSSGTGLSPGDARFEAYIHTYEDLLATDGKLSTYMPLSEDVIQQEEKVPVVSDIYNAIKNSNAKNPAQPYVGDLALKGESANYKELDSPSPPGSSSGADNVQSAATGQADEDDSLSLSQAHKSDKQSFLQGAGLNMIDGLITGDGNGVIKSGLQGDIYGLQSNVQFYGTLVLPALYGMVGAIVFFMRRILDQSRTGPSASTYFVRIALGGLAGVSGGYLLESVHSGEATMPAPGASLFIMAFVFGFSSDLFFRLMDRVVSTISDNIAPDRPVTSGGPPPTAQ